MTLRFVSGAGSPQASLLERAVAERLPADAPGTLDIALETDASLGEESYRIDAADGVWRIAGGDEPGLVYGVGKFLHSACWSKDGISPKPTDGAVSPDCSFRAIYFAVHFYNWYQNAPTEELERYLEELMLWGYNAAIAIIPVINCEKPGDALFKESAEKARKIFRLARKLGMKTGIIIDPNQGAKSAPDELAADLSFDRYGVRGKAGKNICLSKPGGQEYMETVYRAELEEFRDMGLDWLVTWPYDEGGCGCEKCRPWGANGYLRGARVLIKCAKEYYPDIKTVISAWLFDDPEDEGEYDGLYRALRDGEMPADMIMADSHDKFPLYPLTHEKVRPVINFPEISMWKLFPWGGFGANPMPARFESFWRSAADILDGGMPYSEGMYEDISKIQCVGYYWNRKASYREILEEYFSYELSAQTARDAVELTEVIEKNHVAVGEEREPDRRDSDRAGELARSIDARLDERAKNSWRWRILYARGILDEKRYAWYFDHNCGGKAELWRLRHFSGVYLARDEEAQELFRELRRLYHCCNFNGENRWTLPPVLGETVMDCVVG